MKLLIRYGLLAVLLTAVVLLIPPFVASLIEQWSEQDVQSRSMLAFNSALGEFTSLLDQGDSSKIVALFERMALDERLLAVGYCDEQGRLLYSTREMPNRFTCAQTTLKNTRILRSLAASRLFVSSFPVVTRNGGGHVVLLHDLSFADRRSSEASIWSMIALLGIAFLAAALAALVAILLGRRWLQSLRHAIDEVRLGRGDRSIYRRRRPSAGSSVVFCATYNLRPCPSKGRTSNGRRPCCGSYLRKSCQAPK